MSNQKPIASWKSTITNGISASATTIPIDSVTDDEGVSMDGLVLSFVIDKGTSVEEYVTGTVDAAGEQLTSVTRGISVRDGQTSVAALKQIHRKKAPIEITDHPYLAMAMRQLDGTDNLGGVPKNPSSRTISNLRHLADKEYVDLIAAAAGGISSLLVSDAGGITIDIAAGYLVSSDGLITYAGASGTSLTDNATNYVEMKPNGTVSINTSGYTAGYLPLATVVTLSSDITSVTDTRGWFTSPGVERTISTDFTYGATLSAGDPVYIDSSASNKLKKATGADAAHADPFIGIALDAGVDTNTLKRVQIGGYVTSGLSGLTVGFQYLTDAGGLSTTPGTYRKLVGYAPTTTSLILLPGIRAEDISGGNSSLTTAMINEMATFFASTDITAAEAETLTDGSDAGGKHYHKQVILNATRLSDAASGSQTIAHGLGRTPKIITIFVTLVSSGTTTGNIASSEGFSDGTINHCTFRGFLFGGGSLSANLAGYDTSNCVKLLADGTASNMQTAVATFDGTNITLTWTKTGSPSSVNMRIVIKAE